MSKIHLDRGPAAELAAYGDVRRYLCRPRDWLMPDRVTTDEAAVTCGTCLRMIAEGRALVAVVEPFVPDGERPAVFGASAITRRDAAIIQRSIAGEAAAPDHRTLNGALERWFNVRLQSFLPPAPLVEGEHDTSPTTEDRPRMPSTAAGRAVAHSSVFQVEKAVEAACAPGVSFVGGAGGVGALTITPVECRRVIVEYLNDRRSAREIADLVAERMRIHADAITDHQIGLVWRTLRSRLRTWLEERDVIDSDDQTLARARELPYSGGSSQAPEEGMRVPAKYDLVSWKGISQYLGCSEATARAKVSSLVKRLDNGKGEVVWTKAEADQYIEGRDRGAA